MSSDFEKDLGAAWLVFMVEATCHLRWLLACNWGDPAQAGVRRTLSEIQGEALQVARQRSGYVPTEYETCDLVALMESVSQQFIKTALTEMMLPASRDAVCEYCLAPYRYHPMARASYLLGHDGSPVYYRLCDGSLVKL